MIENNAVEIIKIIAFIGAHANNTLKIKLNKLSPYMYVQKESAAKKLKAKFFTKTIIMNVLTQLLFCSDDPLASSRKPLHSILH